MVKMFYNTKAFWQDLGWCVDDDVIMDTTICPCRRSRSKTPGALKSRLAVDKVAPSNFLSGARQLSDARADATARLPPHRPQSGGGSGGGNTARIAGVAAARAPACHRRLCCYRRRIRAPSHEGTAPPEEATAPKEGRGHPLAVAPEAEERIPRDPRERAAATKRPTSRNPHRRLQRELARNPNLRRPNSRLP